MKGRRHHDYVPPGLEKIFAMIHPYRLLGTTGFYGDESMLFVPLQKGLTLAMAVEEPSIRVQMWRGSESLGDVETFAIAEWGKFQSFLSDNSTF